MNIEADNARLRAHMKRVIAEREIASKALREIAYLEPPNPQQTALNGLNAMMSLPFVEPSKPEDAA